MSQSSIVLPAVVQALLSIALLFFLAPARARSMRERGQTIADPEVRLGTNSWSDQARLVSNNYKNQFEIPVLFFAVVALALALRQADGLMVVLAWIFAVSRLLHAAIHIGPNVIKLRAVTFLIGVTAVAVMWLTLGWRVWNGA